MFSFVIRGEGFQSCPLGVRFKVKTSLAFEALKNQVQGRREVEDNENYQEFLSRNPQNTKTSMEA